MAKIINTAVVSVAPSGRGVNEDSFIVNQGGGMYAVLDGATGLAPDVPGLPTTGAKMASQIVGQFLPEMSEGDSFAEEILRASQFLEHEMVRYGVPLEKNRRWGTTVAAIRLLEAGIDWVTVGDSVIVVIKRDGSFFLPGGLDYDHDGEALAQHVELLRQGMTDKEAIDAIMWPIHTRVRGQANIDYGVVNGEVAVAKFIHTGVLPYDDIASVLMLTDGLFLPRPDPTTPDDWESWVSLYRERGLTGVCQTVRDLQTADPNCLRYPRLKPQDDATAVAIEFA